MKKYTKPVKSKEGKYLFCYFTGNEPKKERVHFALSDDGYNFEPLNNNREIIVQTKGTLCMRDPFILRGADGYFYIIATDMKSSLGWDLNHGIVTWKSKDLIHWTDETAIDFRQFEATAAADKIWAPEALYDKERGEYFVYFSAHNSGSEEPICIWYCYTKDFKTFSEPVRLFSPSSGLDAIDADIIPFDNKFYMSYKDECNKTICQVIADRLTGPYKEYDGNVVACTDRNVEGNCTYRISGTNTYVMIMDMYSDGKYFMQCSDDMLHFSPVCEQDYSLAFHPRHGSMLAITDEEYERLKDYNF